jgi:hypothetical protein
MKKQIFTIILLLVGCITAFGQFKLDATGTNDLRLRTNNLDRVNILTNGNVGIGTATPASKLHLSNGSSGLVPIPNMLATFESNTSNYLSFLNGGAGDGGIIFGSSGTVEGLVGHPAGFMVYGSDQRMSFGTGFTTRMTISSLGNVGIGLGNADAASKLHIQDGVSGATPYPDANLTVESDQYTVFNLLSPTTGRSSIFFGYPGVGGSAKGEIGFIPSLNRFNFGTNGATRMTISGTGKVGIGMITEANTAYFKFSWNGRKKCSGRCQWNINNQCPNTYNDNSCTIFPEKV